MVTGPFGFTWWQLSMVANGVIGVASMVMVALIVARLVRLGQLRTNRLAVATLIVFGVLGLQRLFQVSYQVVNLLGDDATFADRQRNVWWLALWQVLIALVAVYLFAHGKAYGRLLIQAFLFDSFAQKQRVEALEEKQRLNEARAEAERERDKHAAMLASVIHTSKSLITVKDLDGRFLMVNKPFELAFGVTQAQLVGRTLRLLDPENAERVDAYDLLARSGLYEYEENMPGPDGQHTYEVSKFALHDGAGAIYAICSVASDITERKRAAELITQARDAAMTANAAKSAFLATMSHEIRTPMNAVIGMTDLLMDTRLDPEQREFVDTVRSSGDALIAVINDILDFSKIEAGELHLEAAPFKLREQVEGCLDFVAAAAARKGLDLVCHVDDSCPELVVGDVVRLRQILANLLSNAVKFTERGDVLLTVSTAPAVDGQQVVTCRVSDTGIGISADAQAQLFTSFSQVDASTTRIYGGTGLGLAISQRLAEAMGGRVTVTSTPGVGSSFCCEVTLAVAPVDRVGPQGPPETGVLGGRSALVVDDNGTSRRILDLQLNGWGMRVTTAESAAAALALVDGGLRYDVAVVNLTSPGQDGVALGRELRQRPQLADVPLVLMTSAGGRPSGADGCFAAVLAKPARSELVREALLAALEPQPVPPSRAAAPAGRRPAEIPLRVLLAEDNPVNQRVAQLMLDKLGHRVDTVGTGVEAVRAAQSSTYDVVLMDVQMPQLDGLEATRQIVASLSGSERPYIVAMTASALVEDRDACAAAGMDGYLSKPVRARELALLLAQVPTPGLAGRH